MMEPHEMSSSPEGNYYSEKGDLTDEKMDTSDTTAGSDKTFSSPESVNGQSKCDNAIVNNSVVADELELKYRMRSDNSTSSLPSDDFDLAKSYQVETVDFPDDPHILKMMNKMTIDKLGFDEGHKEHDEQPIAEIAEDTGPLDDEVFNHGLCQKNVVERTIPKDGIKFHSMSELECTMLLHSQLPPSTTITTTSTPLVDISLVAKIQNCQNTLRITDLHVLCGKLSNVLSEQDISSILQNSDVYSKFLDADAMCALRTIKNELKPTRTTSRTKITVDSNQLDDTIANHFEDDLHLTAVFECVTAQTSRRNATNAPTRSSQVFFEAPKFVLESNSPMQITGRKLIQTPMSFAQLMQNSPNSESDYSCSFTDSYERGDESRKITRIMEESGDHEDASFESERPNNISTDGSLRRKKIAVSPDILCADRDDEKSLSSLSFRSDGEVYSPLDDVATPDDVDTPEELEESCIQSPDPIPELSAAEERAEERRWRTCMIAGVQRKIDMKVIEPYKKVLSHGGYFGPSHYAIIVFGACHLPDHSRKDYDYVMDNLFLYVLTTLDQLVAEDYVLIYLHGAMDRGNMPTFGWLKRCYQMIDRRLRKTLKGLYLVHPTFWLKTLVLMTKPFISTKFSKKLQFVHSLQELAELVPVDQICIPDKVKQLDFEMMIKEKKKRFQRNSW